ncbi:MAG: phosphohydrolase [Flavobacteriaceae bacterium]
MTTSGMEALADRLAETAHKGQRDKTGAPYIDHVRRVSAAVMPGEERVVALLHDVLEKGGMTEEDLSAAGLPATIRAAVDAMTRRRGESDEAFVRRAAANELALPVKKADLEDNLRQAWQAHLPTAKYEAGLNILRDALGGEW